MSKEKYNQDHTTTFMVVYVTANKINVAFTNCDRIRFNSFALTGNNTPYDVYKMLTEEMAESLVSEAVLVDYVKEVQTNNARQYTDIGEMQMVVEFACAELQIPFQVISFEEATNTQTVQCKLQMNHVYQMTTTFQLICQNIIKSSMK